MNASAKFRRLDALVRRFGPAREIASTDIATVADARRLVTILDLDGRLVGFKGGHIVNRLTCLLFEKAIPDAFCADDTEIRGIWFSCFAALP